MGWQPVGGKPFGFDGEHRIGRTGHRGCLPGVASRKGRGERPQPPPGACLAALCSRDRRNGFGWTRLNRRFEGVGVMRNVNRTIRASAKDVIANLASPPQWIEPELCKLVTRIPAGDNWAHEIKFDGPDCQWRCGAANAADRRRDVRSAASRRRGFDAAAAARTQGAAVSAELIQFKFKTFATATLRRK